MRNIICNTSIVILLGAYVVSAGQALEILKSLPPMPFIQPDWKAAKFRESGVCHGAILHSPALKYKDKD